MSKSGSKNNNYIRKRINSKLNHKSNSNHNHKIKSSKSNTITHISINIDEIDRRIIELLIANHDNSSISKKLNIPLPTIQRRTRKLFEKELVSTKVELNEKCFPNVPPTAKPLELIKQFLSRLVSIDFPP